LVLFASTGIIKMNEQQIIDLASSIERPGGEINEDKLAELRQVVLQAVQSEGTNRSGLPSPLGQSGQSFDNGHQKPGPTSWPAHQAENTAASESKMPTQKRGSSGCILS
jgi:hypothetical protein